MTMMFPANVIDQSLFVSLNGLAR